MYIRMHVYHMYIRMDLLVHMCLYYMYVYYVSVYLGVMYIGEHTSVANADTMSSLSLAQQMLINNRCELAMCYNEQSETYHS